MAELTTRLGLLTNNENAIQQKLVQVHNTTVNDVNNTGDGCQLPTMFPTRDLQFIKFGNNFNQYTQFQSTMNRPLSSKISARLTIQSFRACALS